MHDLLIRNSQRSVLLGLLLISTGCAGLDFSRFLKNDYNTATAEQPAVRIMALWKPAEGDSKNGIQKYRGFAGQIFFFTQHSQAPVVVNGDVRIYVFDDQGTPKENAKPIHQFDFSPAAWQTHAQMTNFGPAYNLFIPYTRDGDHYANCSVRVRFTPESGGEPLYSGMSTIELLGSDLARPVDEKSTPITQLSAAAEPQRQKPQVIPAGATSEITMPRQANNTDAKYTEADVQKLLAEVLKQREQKARSERNIPRKRQRASKSTDNPGREPSQSRRAHTNRHHPLADNDAQPPRQSRRRLKSSPPLTDDEIFQEEEFTDEQYADEDYQSFRDESQGLSQRIDDWERDEVDEQFDELLDQHDHHSQRHPLDEHDDY